MVGGGGGLKKLKNNYLKIFNNTFQPQKNCGMELNMGYSSIYIVSFKQSYWVIIFWS